MLRLIEHGDARTLTIELPSPTVYLDHCIVRDLAGTEKGERLRQRISAQGTLYLSWAHFIELFSLGDGPTFQRYVTYLKSFGANFIIIDSDPNAVIKREEEWVWGKQNPAVDEPLLKFVIAHWKKDNPTVTIGVLLDFLASGQRFFEEIKKRHPGFKDGIKTIFDRERQRYRTDKEAKKVLDSIAYTYRPPCVTPKVNLELARACVRTHEQFNPSDSLDFCHAVVSISYCQFVVLDKKWARRCNSLDLPKGHVATVFDGTEIDKLLAALNA